MVEVQAVAVVEVVAAAVAEVVIFWTLRWASMLEVAVAVLSLTVDRHMARVPDEGEAREDMVLWVEGEEEEEEELDLSLVEEELLLVQCKKA